MTIVQETYKQRKLAKVCVSCGKINDRFPKVNCSKCAEYQANYQKNRARLIQQTKKKLNHMGKKEYQANYRKNRGELIQQAKVKFNYIGRKEYEYRKEHGYCVTCGWENDRLPKVTCSKCAQYQENYRKKHRQTIKLQKEKEKQSKKEIVKRHGEKIQPQLEGSKKYEQPKKPLKWVNNEELMKQKQDEENKQTTNNEFTKGFELGRRLGRKNLYEEINELFDEIVIDTIKADDLKNILKLVKA